MNKAARLGLPLLLGAVAALPALFLTPALNEAIGPASIALRAHPGDPRTVLRFPPLGTVEARTHRGPLTLEVALTELDIPALADVFAGSPDPDRLEATVERELRAAAQRSALVLLGVGLAAGALTGVVVVERRWADAAAGAAGGAATVLALLVVVGATFDPDAFAEPRFTGALERAPVVIEALQQGDITVEGVRSRYHTAAERLTELLAAVADPHVSPRPSGVALLHISDIHSNPLGVDIARELARRFDVDAVLDTGDLTNFGVTLEGEIARLVRRIDVPYYFVPGNHDSAANETRLAATPNVIVVDDDLVDIEGVELYGRGDPTDTNFNNVEPDDAADIRRAEGEDVAAEVERLRPDVLAVHDARMAEAAIGSVPVVIAGHEHKRDLEIRDGTLILKVGSTGATGFKFFVEADRAYEAEIVYFEEGRPVAVDYVSFSGLGSDFQIDRTAIDLGEEGLASRRP